MIKQASHFALWECKKLFNVVKLFEDFVSGALTGLKSKSKMIKHSMIEKA